MTQRQIKFGVAPTGVGGPGAHGVWLEPEIPGDASVDIHWYIDVARRAEQAKLDYVFIVDSQFITADSPPHYLNRLEPLTLLSAIAVSTTNIGLIATLSTTYHAPFSVARRFASLDLISKGRAGWNVVTTGDQGTAGNFGLDEHPEHPDRYARALEHVRVVQGLWDSYEDDAFPRDRVSGVFFDPTKLHALDHDGEYFSVTGPLNLQRSPQGQPVIFQAGDSDWGRDLGAEIGDAIFTHQPTLEAGQKFYAEIKARAAAKGRNPDEVLIVPGVNVIVGDTDEHARELEAEIHRKNTNFDKSLAQFGRTFGWLDFTQFDLDAPFPDIDNSFNKSFRTQGDNIIALAKAHNLTLRETVLRATTPSLSPFVGSAETVANELERWFTGRAVDGYNLMPRTPSEFARFTDEVLPILQSRGLFRTEYESSTLRGNLGLPIPENRYTVAAREQELEPAP